MDIKNTEVPIKTEKKKIRRHIDAQHYDLAKIRRLSKEGKVLYTKKKTDNRT